jgi:Domain of unknown function (DUF5615)
VRFIIDAQLPPALADFLRRKGHDAAALREIGLRDADDRDIWSRAESDNATIITKDEDFALCFWSSSRPLGRTLSATCALARGSWKCGERIPLRTLGVRRNRPPVLP